MKLNVTSHPPKIHGETNEWIRNPFLNIPNHLSVQEEDQLVEIANDGGLKSVFEQISLAVFWIKTKAEYLEIAVKALKTLLPFPTTYQCKVGFSVMTKNNCSIDWTFQKH